MGNVVTVGVYANQSYKVNVVAPEDLIDHIEYNKTFRCGRALFVDGICLHPGYLNKEEIKKWERQIEKMTLSKKMVTQPYQ